MLTKRIEKPGALSFSARNLDKISSFFIYHTHTKLKKKEKEKKARVLKKCEESINIHNIIINL
jgi:hypothetical protein